jgi:phage tail-like protein
MPPQRVDPLIARSFFLDMGSHGAIENLTEVSGLDIEADVTELTQIAKGKTNKPIVVKTLGATPLKPGKLTVKYYAFKGDPFDKWRADVINGKMSEARINASLILYDSEGKEQVRFSFLNAWPSKRAFSNLSSKSNEALAVTITLEHEGVQVTGYNQ